LVYLSYEEKKREKLRGLLLRRIFFKKKFCYEVNCEAIFLQTAR